MSRWNAIRGFLALGTALTVAACGSGGSSPTSSSSPCTPGAVSSPRSAGDPCPQTGTACAAAGMLAVSMCLPTKSWSNCACVAGNGSGGSGPATGAVGMCGDGIIQAARNEQCDGTNLAGVTCASLLGPSSAGVISCTNCMLNATMCTRAGGGMAGTSGH